MSAYRVSPLAFPYCTTLRKLPVRSARHHSTPQSLWMPNEPFHMETRAHNKTCINLCQLLHTCNGALIVRHHSYSGDVKLIGYLQTRRGRAPNRFRRQVFLEHSPHPDESHLPNPGRPVNNQEQSSPRCGARLLQRMNASTISRGIINRDRRDGHAASLKQAAACRNDGTDVHKVSTKVRLCHYP